MYPRNLKATLKRRAGQYPVVTVTGPRQSGKTTLVRETFPKKPYVNLENLATRELAQRDPQAFLARYPDGAILDEIQQAPHLLSYIQVIVDEADREGMYILTGSHQIEVHQAISQSLAGRTALLSLLPMSLGELEAASIDLTLWQALVTGGYPRIYRKQLEPSATYRDYVQTYLERDLRQLIQIRELGDFQRFLRLCAGRIGQLLNTTSLSNDVGVSVNTIRHWLSVLEASYLVILLRPYHENFGKRVIKSPKLYFTDVGLACYLLGIESETQVERDPLYGNLFENLVLLELVKSRINQGKDPNLTFYRDIAGHEVDFIYQQAHQLVPIEVKGGQTFTGDYLKGVERFRSLVGKRCEKGYIIYAGPQEQAVGPFELINYRHSGKILAPLKP